VGPRVGLDPLEETKHFASAGNRTMIPRSSSPYRTQVLPLLNPPWVGTTQFQKCVYKVLRKMLQRASCKKKIVNFSVLTRARFTDMYTQHIYYIYNIALHTYTECPTRYQTRHFFNNSNTNKDIAKKFEQECVRCVRNEEECVCSAPSC